MSPVPTLPDQAARERITGADGGGLAETLFVEAGAGSGKTRALVERVVALVRGGVELRTVAAITFTEKAATELRDRLRSALRAAAEAAEGSEAPGWRRALEQLDGAAIGTLHSFAQRLLTERPIEAELPPNADVLDEVSSGVEFDERWERFRAGLLDDDDLRRPLLLAFAAGLRLEDLRQLALAFDANWDLLAERVPWTAGETRPGPVDVADLLHRIAGLGVEADGCRDGADLLCERIRRLAVFGRRLAGAPDEYERLRLLGDAGALPSCRVGSRGRKSNWDDVDGVRARVAALGEEIEALRGGVAQACLRRLAVAVRDFTLEAAAERRSAGRLSFHDLLVLARALLRGPHGPQVRAAFSRRYRRMLLDEFQDTDPIQVEIAVLLASPDAEAGSKPWQEVETTPGALFFVGDPKQSIYRFRRADIGLFLAARTAFAGEPLQLVTNFRTTPPVLDWVNHVFGQLIVPVPDSQPAYEPLAAAPHRSAPPAGPAVAVLGREAHADGPDADTLRAREAADVAATVVEAITAGWQVRDRLGPDGRERWRRATLGDVTVLIPARTSLPALERALEERSIPYRAETSSLVYSTPEIRDLLAAMRALADPTDQLALVTALRSPLFGCGDDDLATYKLELRGRWDLTRAPDGELPPEHPVVESMAVLHAWYREAHWLTPSELLDRIARERRMFELAFAGPRPREVWRRVRFVVDQAREWGERSGGTLREYVAWARLQASESARVAETVLPETDDDSVRIMTVHGAKGLEFPITIVSGLTSRPGGRRGRVQVTWPPSGPVGLRLAGGVSTEEFEAFAPVDEQMGAHERLRLLYVACTRAQDHLVVSLHRKPTRPDARTRSAAELLAEVAVEAPAQVALDLDHTRSLPPAARAPEPPSRPPQDWEREQAALLAGAARPRTIAATAVARAEDRPVGDTPGDRLDQRRRDPLDDPRAAVDAGLVKDPRDLDLPPWLKGRYGTAVGRAVHAVLQTVDLTTGEGVVEAAAAQAAAEGVTGREAEIEALARAALASPSVREAARHESWRETYVAAPVAGVTLEGYIDLLYRTGAGLVVVDYKTASRTDDLDRRVEAYRLQAASYALALGIATGQAVARCVFVFLTPSGADEREVTDLAGAVEAVRRHLTGANEPTNSPA